MESFDKSNKSKFLFLEVLGTAIMVLVMNLQEDDSEGRKNILPDRIFKMDFTKIQVIVSLITYLAWESSSAHFNSAITIGAFLFNYEKWRENLRSLFAILAAQFVGIVLGLFFMFMITDVKYIEIDSSKTYAKTFDPEV